METVKEQTHLIIDIEGRDLLSVFMHGMKGLYSRKITWNELMPVVEKINSLKVKTIDNTEERVDVIIYRNTCHINDEQQIIIEETGRNMIESTYKAVVSFIKWYNQNKQS